MTRYTVVLWLWLLTLSVLVFLLDEMNKIGQQSLHFDTCSTEKFCQHCNIAKKDPHPHVAPTLLKQVIVYSATNVRDFSANLLSKYGFCTLFSKTLKASKRETAANHSGLGPDYLPMCGSSKTRLTRTLWPGRYWQEQAAATHRKTIEMQEVYIVPLKKPGLQHLSRLSKKSNIRFNRK